MMKGSGANVNRIGFKTLIKQTGGNIFVDLKASALRHFKSVSDTAIHQ